MWGKGLASRGSGNKKGVLDAKVGRRDTPELGALYVRDDGEKTVVML